MSSIGYRVRLRTEVRRKVRVTLDVRDNEFAIVNDINHLLGEPVAILDRELAGSRVWETKHLTHSGVVQVRPPKRQEAIPLQFRKSLLPAQRRQLLQGESHGNLDFGFTPTQAQALDQLEAAIQENEHPCIGGDRRRQRRAAVIDAYHLVLKLKLRDALTPTEQETCTELFVGNTVL